MKKVSSVDEYVALHSNFAKGLTILRNIINSTELEETIKWGAPVYTLNGKNVLGLGAFKNHFGLWFFNGVFLKDKKNLLVTAQETTRALRQMRFESYTEIDSKSVLDYLSEAIENQKQDKELKAKKKGNNVIIPKELSDALKKKKLLNNAFKSLTPYKQREDAEYIDTAKRAETKQSRLDKIIPMISKGIGLNDKYKNC